MTRLATLLYTSFCCSSVASKYVSGAKYRRPTQRSLFRWPSNAAYLGCAKVRVDVWVRHYRHARYLLPPSHLFLAYATHFGRMHEFPSIFACPFLYWRGRLESRPSLTSQYHQRGVSLLAPSASSVDRTAHIGQRWLGSKKPSSAWITRLTLPYSVRVSLIQCVFRAAIPCVSIARSH